MIELPEAQRILFVAEFFGKLPDEVAALDAWTLEVCYAWAISRGVPRRR